MLSYFISWVINVTKHTNRLSWPKIDLYKGIIQGPIFGLCCALAMLGIVGCQTTTTFQSADVPPSQLKIRLAKQQGKPVPTAILGPTVSGILKKPDGDGPFPAVIMLPTSGGWKHTPKYWQGLLNDWGYVTLEVHSFEARGYTTLPSYQPRDVVAPAGGMLLDAIGANRHLRTLLFVDGSRIAIMGWSFGAMTALAAVDKLTGSVNFQDRFAAAVAFYPGCEASGDFFAPALVLIGELDDEVRPSKCRLMLHDKPDGSAPIELKIYPDSYHKFDAPGVPKFIEGHFYKYNAAATADAKARVQAFLGKHL